MRTLLLSALTVLAFAAPAFADDDNTIAMPPAGTTILNLSTTETTKLSQDTLNANLQYEKIGATSAEVQDEINKAVAAAIAESRKVSDVKTSTGYYNVYMYDDAEGGTDPKTGRALKVVRKWRGSQSIQLEGMNPTALLELAGKIQGMGFTMNGLTYSLSPEKAKTVQDDLMQKALKKIGDKAKIAQTALGKGGYDILDVNIDGASPPVYPMYKTMRMDMAVAASAPEMATPTAQAGETEVSMTVNARVLLKP